MMPESKHIQRAQPEDLASLAAQSRRHLEDNSLLEALTLVIESNAEYARGVTTILDSDLEREVLLNDIKKDLMSIRKVLEKNNTDIESLNTKLSNAVEKLEKVDNNLAEQLKEKLKPLYVAADLQDTGESYNPTDKLVVTFQKVLSSKVTTMLGGVLIWYIAKLLFESLK